MAFHIKCLVLYPATLTSQRIVCTLARSSAKCSSVVAHRQSDVVANSLSASPLHKEENLQQVGGVPMVTAARQESLHLNPGSSGPLRLRNPELLPAWFKGGNKSRLFTGSF